MRRTMLPTNRRVAVCRSSGAIHRPPDAPDDVAPYLALMTSRLIEGEQVSGGMLLTRAILGAVAAELVSIFMSF